MYLCTLVPIASGTQRSSSYGRGLSWTTPSTPSTSEIPDWATNTWMTHSQVNLITLIFYDSWFIMTQEELKKKGFN